MPCLKPHVSLGKSCFPNEQKKGRCISASFRYTPGTFSRAGMVVGEGVGSVVSGISTSFRIAVAVLNPRDANKSLQIFTHNEAIH